MAEEPCKIPLKNRKGEVIAEALIDCDDLERTSEFRWHKRTNYKFAGYTRSRPEVCVQGRRKGSSKLTKLHRLIMNSVGPKLLVDHVNGNPFDNQKSNLRPVTNQENAQNQRPKPGQSSRYRGVYWDKTEGRWVAAIGVHGKKIRLGSCAVEEECAEKARAAREHYFPYDVVGQQQITA